MKILIAAASFSSNISGLPRHAFNVAKCLLKRPEISAVQLVIAPWQRTLAQAEGLDHKPGLTLHIADMGRGSLSRNRWYYWRLPELAASLRPDVVHLSFPVPLNARSLACPTVVTLHDLYPYEIPENFGFPHVLVNRLILRQCLRAADSIACVSETTKLRLKQYAPETTWQKAVRIYNCVEPPQFQDVASPLPRWQGEPFLLCIAQHRSNKNIPLLIGAFHRLLRVGQISSLMRLVVVGITGPETGRIRRLISAYHLADRVHLLEGLSEGELQWCYAQCEALAAPSATEGFGLPVAEALLAGCPVICSNIPALREVGGEHCRYVDLDKNAEETLGGAIVASLKQPPTAPLSLPQFSAPVIAEQYIRLYRSLAASVPVSRKSEIPASLHTAASQRQSL